MNPRPHSYKPSATQHRVVAFSPPKRPPWYRVRIAKLLHQPRLIIGALLLLGIVFIISWSQKKNDLIQPHTETTASTKKSKDEVPKFITVLPGGKSIADLGGWTRVSPDSADPVFAYVDNLDGSQIIVSQQPLPDTFQSDPEGHIAELAKSYNASDKISTTTTTIYIGDSIKGPQSVICTKSKLLILIKSSVKHSNDSWIRYINSLS
ncbi:hypothetical protein L336_0428 [Candidatus Saccharimonas aalborgensis]|uniref:Uncharacterized protein n=1 Tax=Candidatus Saccharimonas aalborgensis TaxID=1332188 RepID=R4PY40_9BACT|nr:hypothetical protein L336_0428 [Candidatus Saccharimonas aalborgensis]